MKTVAPSERAFPWVLAGRLCRLRLVIFWRMLREIGFLRSLFLLFGLGWLLFRVAALASPALVAALAVLPAAAVHALRRDRAFLLLLTPRPQFIFMVEYALLALPWLLVLALQGRWAWLPLPLGCALLLAVLPHAPSQALRPQKMTTWLPPQAYEWRAWLRQWWLGLLLVYGLCALLPQSLLWLLVAALLLLALSGGCHFQCEPRLWLELPQRSATSFLWWRARLAAVAASLLLLPLVLAIGLFHPAFWWLGLAVWVAAVLFHCFAVFQKYASWAEGATLAHHGTLHLLCLAGFLIPLLLPLPLLLTWRAYRRAKANLAEVLPM